MASILILAVVVLYWFCLIEAILIPGPQWLRAGKSKGAWVTLLIFFGIFAGIPYLISIRNAVKSAK
jgi:hypothetical protein